MSVWRPSRACAWFYANWGDEESKHSLALADWLLRSRARTEEQMTDLEGRVFAFEWRVPHDSPVAMLAYAMVQELATGLCYRNLRQRLVGSSDDPALRKLLGLLGVDEQAHHSFFLKAVGLCLRHDREGTAPAPPGAAQLRHAGHLRIGGRPPARGGRQGAAGLR
jgi:acyl-[acyl-carrier-protein] desaturase